MALPCDLYQAPTQWKATVMLMRNGSTFTMYQDPSNEFVSLTPVTSRDVLLYWWNSQSALRLQTTMKAAQEREKLRELMWARKMQAVEVKELGLTHATEEWWVKTT